MILKKSTLLSYIWIVLLIFLYTPRIPILTDLEKSTSIRFDTLTNLLFEFLIIFYFFSFHYSKKFLFIIVLLISILIQGNSPISIKIVTILHYSALLCFSKILFDFQILKKKNLYKILKTFTLINASIHSLSLVTGFNYIITTDLGENIIAGTYGILHAPYNFALLIFSGIIIELKKHKKLFSPYFIFLLFNLATADSRISFGAGILCIGLILFQNGILKKSTFLTSIIIIVLLTIGMSSSLKSFTILNSNDIDLTSDASLAMRIVNFENYLDWLTLKNLIFGGGSRVYTTFVTQYGLPGPFDNLYLRILSEAGLIGLSILMIFTYNNIKKLNSPLKSPFIIYCIFLFIFGFFNESFLSIKGGNIVIICSIILMQKNEKI